jgi:hypothetical protein
MARSGVARCDNLPSTANTLPARFSARSSPDGHSVLGADDIRRSKRLDIRRCVGEFAQQKQPPDRLASCHRDNDRFFRNQGPAGHPGPVPPDRRAPTRRIRRLENDRPDGPDRFRWRSDRLPKANRRVSPPTGVQNISHRVRNLDTWLHESHR